MSGDYGIEDFFTALGGRPLLRMHLSAFDGQETEFGSVGKPFLLVGRSDQCDVTLEGSDVSHRHAYMQLIGNRVFCADLGSRTGVHWHDGARASGWLDLNERLAIGQYNFRFDLRPDARALSRSEPRFEIAASSPPARLRFLNARVNTDRCRQWPLFRPITLLGHLPSCDIPLQHQSVSRVHASLVRTRLGLWVVDLLGKGGVRVNGERVAQSQLADLDVLEIGRFRMVVQYSPGNSPGVSSGEALDELPDRRREVSVTEPEPAPSITWRAASLPHAQAAAPDQLRNPAAASPSSGLSEEFVLSVLNQSAAMQQQMMTQQNQMMMLTMKMLSALHSQNTSLVRDELDRVQELTQEIQELQAKLIVAGATGRSSDELEERLISEHPGRARLTGKASTSAVAPGPDRFGLEDQACVPSSATETPRMSDGVQRRSRVNTLDGIDLHSQLTQRLAELERKRSGYWRSIVRAFLG